MEATLSLRDLVWDQCVHGALATAALTSVRGSRKYAAESVERTR